SCPRPTDRRRPTVARSRILVIDDEPGILRAVERILSCEHHVTTADTPERGLELLHSNRIDLVLCDISMPGIDGFEVLREAQSVRPEPDVILMTGMNDAEAQLVRAIR